MTPPFDHPPGIHNLGGTALLEVKTNPRISPAGAECQPHC